MPPPRPSETAVVAARADAAALPGEPPSFEAVYRAQAKTVIRWATRLLGPGGDIDDVAQEVFLVVKRRLPEFRGDAALTTWLYEITVRVAQDWRKRGRWWSWVLGRGPSPSRGRGPVPFMPVAEAPRDPQALLEAQERTQLLYRLLDELSEDARTTFILFELEGLSGEEVAALTRVRVGTVWVRLSRARHAFLKRLRAWESLRAREDLRERPVPRAGERPQR